MRCSSCSGKHILVYRGHPLATYSLLRNSLGDSRRLSFPRHLWHLVFCGTSGGAAYVRFGFVEGMLSLLSLFLELARLNTVWPRLQLLPWDKYMGICLHPLGEDFVGAVSSRTQFTVPNLLCSSLPLADLSYFTLALVARCKILFFLC